MDYFAGTDLFIADELKFLACLESWFTGILKVYADDSHLHELADKLSIQVAKCIGQLLALERDSKGFRTSLLHDREIAKSLHQMQFSPDPVVSLTYSRLMAELGPREPNIVDLCFEREDETIFI